jgi:hypothetical protein
LPLFADEVVDEQMMARFQIQFQHPADTTLGR